MDLFYSLNVLWKHFVFNVFSESVSNIGNKFSLSPLSANVLVIAIISIILKQTCSQYFLKIVRLLVLLGIYVSALIDVLRYGISMIHIIRGRTGPNWTRGSEVRNPLTST